MRTLAERDVKVLHCPGSNLKLGSGLAPVVEMRAKGISVSLGADGAACNNHLDMFEEMRLAAVLQSVRHHPGALTARDAVWMATREGARALGLEREIGSIETGKRADLILVDADGPDPYSTIVYASRGTNVRTTIIDGEVLVDDFRPSRWDSAEIVRVQVDQVENSLLIQLIRIIELTGDDPPAVRKSLDVRVNEVLIVKTDFAA